jgi:hypothetical protein
MLTPRSPLAVLTCLFALGLAACNLPTGTATQPPAPGQDVIQQTLDILVLTAQAEDVTAMPEVSPTASLTPPPSETPTPEKPMVSVSVNTNCRTGPGQIYDYITALTVGRSAEVVAVDPGGNYYYIRNPDNPATFCWLWGQYATVAGNLAGLPVFTPPPTPTPAPGFNVTYVGTVTCAGSYAFRFQIANTGGITWESIRIVAKDNVAATSTTHTLDSFRAYNGCILEIEHQDLMPGEGGPVTNVNPGQIAYDPAGRSFTAEVTLCSQNGLGGTCLTKSIDFTP